MKATVILLIYTLASGLDSSLSYYPLQGSDELLLMLFHNEKVQASSITHTELDILDKIIKTEFSNIGDGLKFPDSLTAIDYHYQLVTVTDSLGQKLVAVNAASKSLPSWTLSKIGSEFLSLKCVGNGIFGFKVNLDTRSCYRPWNQICE